VHGCPRDPCTVYCSSPSQKGWMRRKCPRYEELVVRLLSNIWEGSLVWLFDFLFFLTNTLSFWGKEQDRKILIKERYSRSSTIILPYFTVESIYNHVAWPVFLSLLSHLFPILRSRPARSGSGWCSARVRWNTCAPAAACTTATSRAPTCCWTTITR